MKRFLMFFDHHGTAVWVLFAASQILPSLVDPGLPYLWLLPAPVLLLLWGAGMYVHTRTLCVRCSKVPLNGPHRAERRQLSLRMFHIMSKPWMTIAAIACGMAIHNDILFGWFIMWSWMQARHRPLVFWCPQCRGHDDGWEYVETPDPVESGSK